MRLPIGAPARAPVPDPRRRARGQSMAELALMLPVILLMLLVALDFGRVYLGWINLNQMARIAANYASTNPDAAFDDPNGAYQRLVRNDARATNCDLLPVGSVDTVPPPTFSSGSDLGDPVTVSITCRFGIITPIISAILGNSVDVSASSTFAVRTGAVAGIPTGGGGTSNAPIADFSASPTSGNAPLVVQFTDLSSNAPLTFSWNFGDGSSSSQQHPSHTYADPGTYTVSLTVGNPAGSDTETKTGLISVGTPPSSGLVADFTGAPLSGTAPLAVTFTDGTTGGTPTSWTWTFGNGTTRTGPGPHTITYGSAGTYTVSLTVSDGTSTDTTTKSAYVSVATPLCDVPNVSDGETRTQAIAQLQAAGFTNIVSNPSNGSWTVKSQSPAGGFTGYPCSDPVTISNK